MSMRFKRKEMRLPNSLALVLLAFLSGCDRPIVVTSCPVFPYPDPKVADELEKYCMPQEKCPHLWDWMNNLYVLDQQLQVKE